MNSDDTHTATDTKKHSSTLFVVGTPIGNLADLSPRARQTLAAVGAIACEDTRRTGLLLQRFSIENPGMIIVNAHTERAAAQKVVEVLARGENVALVSDAGMPVISDPGAVVVGHVRALGYQSVVVPGPCAISAALALTGFDNDGRFCFEGFLPRKGRERSQRITELAAEQRQIVIYEAPHRLQATLSDLACAFDGSRLVSVARELTKLHETVWSGPISQALEAEPKPRGEYVIVIDAAKEVSVEIDDGVIRQKLAELLASGLSKRDAIRQCAKELGVARNRVYDLATEI